MIKLLCLSLIALATIQPVFANSALVFRRDIITIKPKHVPVIQDESGAATTAPQRQPIQIAAEIRSEQALQLDWVHSLSRIGEKQSMIILFDPPVDFPIFASNVYQPLDILHINAEGIITHIIPDIILFELQEPIASPNPIRARMFLTAGNAEKLDIRPGDRVDHPLFTPKPRILSE